MLVTHDCDFFQDFQSVRSYDFIQIPKAIGHSFHGKLVALDRYARQRFRGHETDALDVMLQATAYCNDCPLITDVRDFRERPQCLTLHIPAAVVREACQYRSNSLFVASVCHLGQRLQGRDLDELVGVAGQRNHCGDCV
jgi:hypothetical protein